MNKVDIALKTQLENIQEKTGMTLDDLYAVLRKSGLTKHGEMVAMAKDELELGHGDANTLVHLFRKSQEEPLSGDPVDRLYSGEKAHLRPIHDKIMAAIESLGAFDVAPKKAYLSLRRKKQFAMVGPATKSQVEVGINVRDLATSERLKELPPGRMCSYAVRISSVEEIDGELLKWVRTAYERAG